MSTQTQARGASQKQVDLINRLKQEREVPEAVLAEMRAEWRAGTFTARRASTWIDALFSCPRVAAAVAPEGMHRDADGRVFKVQVSPNSGRAYAKALLQDEDGAWAFGYAPGACARLSAATKMSLADAKAWGVLYGTCCVCGRTLTNEKSIEAGIGPVCAERF